MLKSNLPAFIEPPLDLNDYKPSALAEFHPLNNPNYPFGILAGLENASSSEKDLITWNEVGSAMVIAARNLLQDVELSSHSSPPSIALISRGDPMVYFTMVLTVIRTGCIPFLISPRNSPVAIAHLLKEGKCAHAYVPFELDSDELKMTTAEKVSREQMDKVIKHLPQGYSLNLRKFPTAFELFPRLAKGLVYDFNHDLPQQMPRIPKLDHSDLDPVIFLHSSGSTGLPKLIPLNRITFQSTYLTFCNYGQFDWTGEITSALVLPPFHALGIYIGLFLPLSRGTISGFFRPEHDLKGRCVVKTLNPLTIMQAMRSIACTVVALSPLTLAEYAQDPTSVNFLRGVKRVTFGGAPLSSEVGNFLHREGVKLSTIYGSTEAGILSVCLPDPCLGEDWEYFEIPSQINTQLIPREDGLFELVILSSDKHRCSFTFEKEFGPQTFHTNDLLAKHPTRPLYRTVGRLDDQIVLSNSEKTNPVPLETILAGDPAIQGALLFGRGKPMVGVIIEPEDNHRVDVNDRQAVEAFIDKIWPSVEAVNRSTAAHSRLTRSLILVIDPKFTSLPKTSKGAVARTQTLALLAQDIEKIYSNVLGSNHPHSPHLELVQSIGKVSENSIFVYIKKLVESVLGRDVKENEDLFLQGCDSVHAASIRLGLVQLFKMAIPEPLKTPLNIVYQYPTITKLSKSVSDVLSATNQSHSQPTDVVDPCRHLHLIIKKYLPCDITI
ncbi:hypothetical protein CROQUDRAFT_67074 [Cronartium quercuum f. sp. fusiforme G11]|uniref:AMP-dependent synthetase/ligase domain-containing protein n=1 Tax=Cronartium quercuum f. sp. fusiforme G11 TaxID=708437 RepID=A0A9P6NF91_9BASI|nr:hypothetical protein CROQUDRAFT_67074 [Cronartium quercuum f. sp. fusiforme G11]